MATQRKPYISVEEYLAMEKDAAEKHEYLAGEIFAMAGGTPDQNRISLDSTTAVANQLAGRDCEAFGSDQRVRTALAGLYTYPDLTIVCGEPQFDQDTLTNATAIFEVLSPSTEAYDRGEKLRQYHRIPTLDLYVLISQDKPQVEVYERKGESGWSYSLTEGLEAAVELRAIGCTLRLSDIYARVKFPVTENIEEGHSVDDRSTA